MTYARSVASHQLVEDIAATLQVRRGDLNVVAASKGLFAGALEVFAKDGSVIEGGPKVSKCTLSPLAFAADQFARSGRFDPA